LLCGHTLDAFDGAQQVKIGIGNFQITNNVLANTTLGQQVGEKTMSNTGVT